MNDDTSTNKTTDACLIDAGADLSGIKIINITPDPALADYLEATALANKTAENELGDHMLLSWYDRDRDFEAPQHTSECHADSAIPGYVDYGISHGATLMIDIENGRFVFFYLALNMQE